ncbi:unnamed protein product [Acanthosepion pharaonis]|uniref:Uncharacterized protein n=1 Tax=Acanthosepion pharaonis TaxID=158019 RepID=A0A812DQ22_ACAPH|nr:unnamed protein product [Sepia pharaonis]
MIDSLRLRILQFLFYFFLCFPSYVTCIPAFFVTLFPAFFVTLFPAFFPVLLLLPFFLLLTVFFFSFLFYSCFHKMFFLFRFAPKHHFLVFPHCRLSYFFYSVHLFPFLLLFSLCRISFFQNFFVLHPSYLTLSSCSFPHFYHFSPSVFGNTSNFFTVWTPPKRRKLLGQRTAAASATRAARVSETPEQTSLRLSRMALSSAARLSTESSAARTERLTSAASTMSARRARLSVEEHSLQNSQYAVRVTRLRASQSPAQKTLRRLRDATAKACSRDEPPQPLRDLLLGTTSKSTHFLEAIRKYKCCFQMTSFGAKAISEAGWMPTFKVQGQVYHLIGSLLAHQGEPPQFLQIYFLADYNEQVDARLGILPSDISVGPRRDILFRLQYMLHESNSYIRSLKFVLQNNSSPSFSVVIDVDRRPHGKHERRFNAPVCNEVAAVIHGEEHNSRDIVIRYRGGGLRRISKTHRSCDFITEIFLP